MSRTTYERLKAFCESNNISMSQLVENRVNDFLGGESTNVPAERPRPSAPSPTVPRPQAPTAPSGSSGSSGASATKPQSEARPVAASAPAPQPVPMTSAAARYAVDPPPPVIKQKQQENAPAPTEKRPDQIFTF